MRTSGPTHLSFDEAIHPSSRRNTKLGELGRTKRGACRETVPMEERNETPTPLGAALVGTRHEGTTRSTGLDGQLDGVIPPAPPMSPPAASKAKRTSRLSMWKTNRRKVSSKIYPMDTPVLASAQSQEVTSVLTGSSTPLQQRSRRQEEKIVDTDEKRNVETSTIVNDTTGVKTTTTTTVKTITTTTTTTTTKHTIDTPVRRSIEQKQETETKVDLAAERERIAIRRKRSAEFYRKRKKRNMFAQIQVMQQWRKYQCILVILSWLVNVAQNSITWYSNFTDAIGNVQFVCDDFHSTNYHISNCGRSNKIGVPKAFPPTYGLPEANILRAIGTVLTMLILYCAYKFRKEGVFYDKINHPELTVHMDIYNSGRMGSFMFEVLFSVGHLPPYIEEILTFLHGNGQETSPFIFVVLTSLPFLRFYVLFLYLYYLTRMHSGEGEFISKLTNLKFGYSSTSLKLMYLWSPQLCLLLFSMVCIVIGGIVVHVSESWYCSWKPEKYCTTEYGKLYKTPYLHVLDAIWLKILTLTAIGYGRIVPHTAISKFVCIVTAIVGRLAISAMTANVLQMTGLLELEERAHNFVIKCEREVKMKATAANVIAMAWRLFKAEQNSYHWHVAQYSKLDLNLKFKKTEVFHRESHKPSILRLKLLSRIIIMKNARTMRRRRRIDHAGTIYELDMSRKLNFALTKINAKIFKMENLITNVLGKERAKKSYRGALYVHTDAGPIWLRNLVEKMKEFGSSVNKKRNTVYMKRSSLEYMELVERSRSPTPNCQQKKRLEKGSNSKKLVTVT